MQIVDKICEDTVIASDVGMMDLMQKVADHIGIKGGVSAMCGPEGGLHQISACMYAYGRKGMRAVGMDPDNLYDSYHDDSFTLCCGTEGSPLMTHIVYVVRRCGETRASITVCKY